MSKPIDMSNGGATDANGLTEQEFLAAYRPGDYKHPAFTADGLVLHNGCKPQILLIKRANHPYINHYALPGGFVNSGESGITACQRELFEETSVQGAQLLPLGTFSKFGRDPRDWVITEAFIASVDEKPTVKGGDDAKEALWFDFSWEIGNDRVDMNFECGDIKFSAAVEYKKRFLTFDYSYDLSISDKGRLAFDHAEIVALAILKYLSRNACAR